MNAAEAPKNVKRREKREVDSGNGAISRVAE